MVLGRMLRGVEESRRNTDCHWWLCCVLGDLALTKGGPAHHRADIVTSQPKKLLLF